MKLLLLIVFHFIALISVVYGNDCEVIKHLPADKAYKYSIDKLKYHLPEREFGNYFHYSKHNVVMFFGKSTSNTLRCIEPIVRNHINSFEELYEIAKLEYGLEFYKEKESKYVIISRLVNECRRDSNCDVDKEESNIFWKINENIQPSEFSYKVVKTLEQLAMEGYDKAQFSMAHAYIYGIGVKIDYITAYAWASAAGVQNPPYGSDYAGLIYSKLEDEEKLKADQLSLRFQSDYSSAFKSPSITIIN